MTGTVSQYTLSTSVVWCMVYTILIYNAVTVESSHPPFLLLMDQLNDGLPPPTKQDRGVLQSYCCCCFCRLSPDALQVQRLGDVQGPVNRSAQKSGLPATVHGSRLTVLVPLYLPGPRVRTSITTVLSWRVLDRRSNLYYRVSPSVLTNVPNRLFSFWEAGSDGLETRWF